MTTKHTLLLLIAAFVLASCTTVRVDPVPTPAPAPAPQVEEYEFPVRPKKQKPAPRMVESQPIIIVLQDTIISQPQPVIISQPAPQLKKVEPLPELVVEASAPVEEAAATQTAKEAMETWPFADQLSKAAMAFNTPDMIKLGNSADMQLIIDPTKTAEQIKKEIEAEGSKLGADIQVSKVVVAKVLAPDFEVIEFIEKGRQAIDFNGPTEWRWTITPKKIGEHKVNVTVSAVIEIDGDRAERLIKVFDREIAVTVTPAEAVKFFFSKNWEWFWSAIVLPFFVWMWKQYKKKKRAEEDEEEEEDEGGEAEEQQAEEPQR